MDPKCPGRISRKKISSKMVDCPKCGKPVELFEDEEKVRCKCGQWVFQEAMPSCFLWCKEAKRCMGEIQNLTDKLNELSNSPSHQEELRRLKELRELIASAKASQLPCKEGEGDEPSDKKVA